jgi:hypothetical protein
MNRDMWMGIFRHFLTVVGGFFVAKGYVDTDTVNTTVGAASALIGVGLSLYDKRD